MNEIVTAAPDLRHDRVRQQTKPEINQRIDEETAISLQLYSSAGKELITRRLEELDQELDIERKLEMNASVVILGGISMGLFVNRKWFALPLLASGFLMQHAIQGWCPPLNFFRNRGVRTRKEIERERYGLKLLRGDFDSFHSGERPNIAEILKLLEF